MCACVIFFICIFISGSTSSNNLNNEYKYVVIVDAGSTGSRVHVYKYLPNIGQALIDIDFRNEKYEKFKPGLSKFANLLVIINFLYLFCIE